ncbi:MAG: hypothetical protein QXW67_02125, partial [Candidatus Micrarchaeia archaeon]
KKKAVASAMSSLCGTYISYATFVFPPISTTAAPTTLRTFPPPIYYYPSFYLLFLDWRSVFNCFLDHSIYDKT